MELYSVASQKATTANAVSTVVKPGEEAPIGWADPYTLRQFGVKIVIGGEERQLRSSAPWGLDTLGRKDTKRCYTYIPYFIIDIILSLYIGYK